MTWEFSTEPEFEAKLEWMRKFVHDEVYPLEVLDADESGFMRIIRTLQDEVKGQKLWATHLPPDLGGQGYGQVAGVLDWEIAQLGQPLLDLACLSVVARGGQAGGGVPGGGHVAINDEDLLDFYGVQAGEYRWYLALTFYKYAAIFGYNLMLHRRGKRPDPMYEKLTSTITGMIDEGISMLQTPPPPDLPASGEGPFLS